MDELWEFLTLVQTRKLGHRALILLYGSEFWNRVINFQAMVEAGTIAEDDLRLFQFADTPKDAFAIVKSSLTRNRAMRAAFRQPFP
jgi:predicted Rossmann-fold nucleotide-binding protein